MLSLIWDSVAFQHNMTLIIVAFISGILSPMLVSWLNYKIKNNSKENESEKKEDEMTKFIKHNVKIDERLEVLREENNFDRVWIGRFHNGGVLYPQDMAKIFQKITLLFESCRKGISSEIKTIQNIPVTVFTTMLRGILEKGHFGIANLQQSKIKDESFREFMLSRGIKGFYSVGVKCLDNKFIGILVVESVTGDLVLTDKQQETIMLESKILGGYLIQK